MTLVVQYTSTATTSTPYDGWWWTSATNTITVTAAVSSLQWPAPAAACAAAWGNCRPTEPQARRAPAIITEATRRRDAEAAAHEARQADERKRVHEEAMAAKARARALLLAALSPAQRDSLGRLGYYELDVDGKTYRIRQGTHGNVRLVEGGRETALYCAQPNGVPDEDAMLAQTLMLRTDEAAFLRVANRRALT